MPPTLLELRVPLERSALQPLANPGKDGDINDEIAHNPLQAALCIDFGVDVRGPFAFGRKTVHFGPVRKGRLSRCVILCLALPRK